MDIAATEFFRSSLSTWYKENARAFPWRYSSNPYFVLVSEILLQKTDVGKVIQPFELIISRYPTILELSLETPDKLAPLFQNIGLFYRAERLIGIAKQIAADFQAKVPDKKEELLTIKGVGDYIAGAILCFGYNIRAPIVDTNVVRIISRYFGFVSTNKRPRTDKNLWRFVEELLPQDNYVDFNYSLLDFSSAVCTFYKPLCATCSLQGSCNFVKGKT